MKFAKTTNHVPTKKQLDELWKKVCLARDGYCCRYTLEIHGVRLKQKEAVLQCHHIMRKASHRLRWDINNGITITKGAHFSVAHSTRPTVENQFRAWALGRLPEKARRELEFLERSRVSGGVDKMALKIYLERELNRFLKSETVKMGNEHAA